MGGKIRLTIKDICLIAVLSTILFIQEQLLTFIPNVQFTFLLLILFSRKLGFYKSTIIVIIHVLLDNIIMGSLSIVFTPFMFLGLFLIPLFMNTLFKKINNSIFLAIISVLFSFLYCWIFIIPNYLFYKINPLVYLISDISFEIIFAFWNFFSIFILYAPCKKVLDKLLTNT